MPVTTRIRLVSQPPEGLLPLSLFDRVGLADRMGLHPRSMETVPPDLAGLYVDYMTRVAMGTPVRVAFHVPLLGARLVGQGEYAESLLSRVTDFSPASARAACLLLDFDAASRRGPQYCVRGAWFRMMRRISISRVWWPGRVPFSTSMVRSCGTVSTSRAGYTDRITSGSGDFLTADTLWDFKVSSYRPNPMYTLQLLVYWRMGLHSVHDEYRMVRRLGFFNPRRDEVWLLDVDRIDDRLVDWTDHELIGYPKD